LNYLNQLHTFFVGVTNKLSDTDLLEVTEAVAHVVAAVPNENLANVFKMFCLPIAQQLAGLASKNQAELGDDIPRIIGTFTGKSTNALAHTSTSHVMVRRANTLPLWHR
jgi:transportin-3